MTLNTCVTTVSERILIINSRITYVLLMPLEYS